MGTALSATSLDILFGIVWYTNEAGIMIRGKRRDTPSPKDPLREEEDPIEARPEAVAQVQAREGARPPSTRRGMEASMPWRLGRKTTQRKRKAKTKAKKSTRKRRKVNTMKAKNGIFKEADSQSPRAGLNSKTITRRG